MALLSEILAEVTSEEINNSSDNMDESNSQWDPSIEHKEETTVISNRTTIKVNETVKSTKDLSDFDKEVEGLTKEECLQENKQKENQNIDKDDTKSDAAICNQTDSEKGSTAQAVIDEGAVNDNNSESKVITNSLIEQDDEGTRILATDNKPEVSVKDENAEEMISTGDDQEKIKEDLGNDTIPTIETTKVNHCDNNEEIKNLCVEEEEEKEFTKEKEDEQEKECCYKTEKMEETDNYQEEAVTEKENKGNEDLKNETLEDTGGNENLKNDTKEENDKRSYIVNDDCKNVVKDGTNETIEDGETEKVISSQIDEAPEKRQNNNDEKDVVKQGNAIQIKIEAESDDEAGTDTSEDISMMEENGDRLWKIDESVLIMENGKLDHELFLKYLRNASAYVDNFVKDVFPEILDKADKPEIQRRKRTNDLGIETLLMEEIVAAKENPIALQKLIKIDSGLATRKEFVWGYTALHWATKANNLKSIKILLKAKADPCAQSHGGTTPLHIAAMNNYTQAMRLLLEGGANLDITSNSGLKARDVAKGNARFILQNRLNCWDYSVIKSIIPNPEDFY